MFEKATIEDLLKIIEVVKTEWEKITAGNDLPRKEFFVGVWHWLQTTVKENPSLEEVEKQAQMFVDFILSAKSMIEFHKQQNERFAALINDKEPEKESNVSSS